MNVGQKILTIIAVLCTAGCVGPTQPGDFRIKPDFAPTERVSVRNPVEPIKDRNLATMYKQVKEFDAELWENRESMLYDMLGNRGANRSIHSRGLLSLAFTFRLAWWRS